MEHATALKKLHTVIQGIAQVPDSEWHAFSERVGSQRFNQDNLLIRAGAPAANFYFLANGLVRFYYVTEDGREFNKAFNKENDFVGVFTSGLDEPCPFSVQAMEPTTAVILPRKLLLEFYGRHSAWERIGRLQAEAVAARKTLREAEFLLETAEARYLRFLREHADIAERLHQYHIASYIGVTEVALSRIRSRIKRS